MSDTLISKQNEISRLRCRLIRFSLATNQIAAAFYVMGKGKLIKQGQALNAVGLAEFSQIILECLGVAGNIEDVVETG